MMPLDMLYGDAAHHPGGGIPVGYQIARSLRFNGPDTAYLSNVPAAGGSTTKFTKSFWIKRTELGIGSYIYAIRIQPSLYYYMGFDSNDRLGIFETPAGSWNLLTNRVFRDVTAAYHIVIAVDVSQVVTTERVKIYVNGVRETSFASATYPSALSYPNSNAYTHYISWAGFNNAPGGASFILSEFHKVDGQQLPPTAFGQWNSVTKAWEPKQVTLTAADYGPTGFCLLFDDNSAATAAAIGKDSAPIGSGHAAANNWTPTNISVAAGVGNDSLTDTPTNNHPVFNSLNVGTTRANGNLQGFAADLNYWPNCSTLATPTTGKWYAEMTVSAIGNGAVAGITLAANQLTSNTTPGNNATSWAYLAVGQKGTAGSFSAYGASYTSGDVIGIALDLDAGTLTYYKNGVSQGTAFSGLAAAPYCFVMGAAGGGGVIYGNFGQRPFDFTPPTGFSALCSANLPTPAIPDPSAHFDVKLYRGNGGELQVGNIVKEAASVSIAKALRFNDDDTAYLSRTPGSAGNRRLWTWAGWVKRGNFGLADAVTLFASGTHGLGHDVNAVRFNTADELEFIVRVSDSTVGSIKTTAKFRDPSTPLHVIAVFDSANATGTDRMILYVNGVRAAVTVSVTCTLNTDGAINSTQLHRIGLDCYANLQKFDGLMADVHFCDGVALTPSSFGAFDANGVWVPIATSLTSSQYGLNGFRLEFADTSAATAAALGKDTAPTGTGHVSANNWTPNNLSVTAGSGNDALDDTPTNQFPTWDTLTKSGGTTANGNLDWNSGGAGATYFAIKSTIPTLIKCYWECEVPATLTYWQPGIVRGDLQLSSGGSYLLGGASGPADAVGYRSSDGAVMQGGSTLFTGAAGGAAGSIIMFAFDPTTGKLWIGRNGSWFNSGNPAAGTGWVAMVNTDYQWHPANGDATSQNTVVNFGQRAFAHAPPSGFSALSRDNLAAFGEVAGSPDIVWIKGRSAATAWSIYDTVRGATKDFEFGGQSPAESTNVNGLKAFGRDGFYLGNLAKVNTLNATYAAYLFNSSNTAGIKALTYTGNGTTQAISHNLGVKPAFIIVRALTLTTVHACVYHAGLGAASYSYLSASAFDTTNGINRWGNNSVAVEPTTTQFTVGNNADVNSNGVVYIAYVFAPIAGFSAAGIFTGNGSADGPVVLAGLRPKLLMVKRAAASDNWRVFDSVRKVDNVTGPVFYMNANAEATENLVDLLSTGFKVRSSDPVVNSSGASYVWCAWADVPLKYALAR